MKERVWHGYNKDGVTKIAHSKELKAHFLSFGDKPFEIIVRPKRKHRSLNQNAYYWGVVLWQISQDTGHTEDELHEAFKLKFLKRFNEKGLEFIESSAELSTVEFMEFIEKVRRFAAVELGITTPDPNTN